MKKIVIVSICSLFLMACDKTENTTDTVTGLTGNCVDTLKAYDELNAYIYDDKASPLYNKITITEREQKRNSMINSLKTRSQEECKHQANTVRISMAQIKAEDTHH
ncbi:hypothetical protein MTZ49_07710 [Entomomonas sp. E2T0]|uniref:hypothetical protein n=1 Tax=Entomomonas sp. E2T0 TaxID=2930213 RepID=UPI00222818EF|nr:hypothetical protein [Entomomonas sp. E2T0]UYZ85425.1 hypothetical protein MTZ49_07710 [Entomomonas sp. E2T0]